MSVPAGYTPLPSGYFMAADGSGPYVWSGTAMTLASTGSGGGGGGGGAASLGVKTSAASLSVAPSSDGVFLVAGAAATRTDKSGTITAGGTAQTIIASNAARKGFEIQNQSTDNLYFSTLAAAVQGQPSVLLAPGQLYETPLGGAGTGAVSLIGPTTSQAFAAREWV